MKHPKPDKLVVMFGIPITVHSAGVYPNGSSASQRLRAEREARECLWVRECGVVGIGKESKG
jgi:hypothetical protein